MILKMIQHCEFDENDIVNSLNRIKEVELPKIGDQYFSKLIMNPKLFEYPQQRCLRQYSKGYYLLHSSRISGRFVELYTYDWYINHHKQVMIDHPDYEISYPIVKGEDNEPYLNIKSAKEEYQLSRSSTTGKFEYYSDNLNGACDTIEEAIELIIK